MSAAANHTEAPNMSSFSFPHPTLGNGFVDVTTLTTLVGSSVVESLVLGNEGAAGVAWAAVSAFGLLRVVTTCIGAASVGWFRGIMGVRTDISDSAVGMEISCNAKGRGAMKLRRRYGERGPPVGISVDAFEYPRVRGTEAELGFKIVWNEIYAFDRVISWGLSRISPSGEASKIKHGRSNSSALYQQQLGLTSRNTPTSMDLSSTDVDQPPAIYSYTPAPLFHPYHDIWFQIPVLLLSTLKVGEAFILWNFGDGFLAAVTVAPWVYFFLMACIVEFYQIKASRKPEVTDGGIDILAGQFPKLTQATNPRSKIVLGAPRNARKSPWWRLAWALGAMICVPIIVLTYFCLGQQTNYVVALWAAFQASWMVGRIIVHNYAEPPGEVAVFRMLYPLARSWGAVPKPMKDRVVNLVVALTEYIRSVHPRQEWVYRENATTAQELRSVIVDTPTSLHYPAPENIGSPDSPRFTKQQIDIDIRGVIGDPMLLSAAWIANEPSLTFESLYDTCILSFNHPQVTVPCVRFMRGSNRDITASQGIDFDGDPERNQPLRVSPPRFYPKGLLNHGPYNEWWYFIPLKIGTSWLVVRQDVQNPIIGKHSAEVMSNERITALLARGTLGISLSHVCDIKHALQQSEKARLNLVKLLS